jgi:DNA-binding transcriptional LysR family regulator
MTREEFFAAAYIAVEIGRLRPQSFAESYLRELGQERRIEVRVFSFLLAPEMLVDTTRLAVMQQRLARIFATRLPIAIAELPFPFPVMREMVQFNRTRMEDQGLRWLIDQLRAASTHP